MKKLQLIFMLVFFSGMSLFAQDIRFPSAIVSAGGSNSGNSSVLISRWRIGQVVVLTLPVRETELKNGIVEPLPEVPVSGWNATVYPNPVSRLLNIRFDAEKAGQFSFQVVDLTSRKLFERVSGTFQPGQVEKIDFSDYVPGIYILNVIPGDKSGNKLFKIIKN